MNSEEASNSFVIGIIPARWASSRFPGKMLHPIAGKTLVQRVWERCQNCNMLDHLIIATDEEKILRAAEKFGADAVMTSLEHQSGTDRLAEAVQEFPQATQVINIQGDEPQIEPSLIDQLAQALVADPGINMATAATPFSESAIASDPNVVKCALNTNGEALYFSRSPIPYNRNHPEQFKFLRHKGIYAYQRHFLETFVSWEPSFLERSESLEQLRALENGARIKVLITDDTSGGIDTVEQAMELEHTLNSQNSIYNG